MVGGAGWQKVPAKAEITSRERVWLPLVKCPILSGFASFQCLAKEKNEEGKRGFCGRANVATMLINFTFSLWLLDILYSCYFIHFVIVFVCF